MKNLKIAAFVVTVSVALSSLAMTRYVDYANGADSGDGTAAPGWKTLAYAVANAVENDEIVLAKGTHVLGSTALAIDKALLIHGEGTSTETTLDGEYKAGIITISAAGVKLGKVTFTRLGANNQNGFVRMTADSTIEKVVFTGCGSEDLSGQNILKASAGLVKDCYFTGNVCRYNAGIYLAGPAVVENCVFAGNTVCGSGGNTQGLVKITDSNEATLRNCTIVNNTLGGSEAALYCSQWKGSGYIYGKIENCIIWNNKTTSGDVKNFYTRDGKNPTWVNNCISPLTGIPASNFADDPLLDADGMHITAHSPCKWTADPSCATEYDIAGVARGETPSVGAFEYAGEAVMELDVEKPGKTITKLPETIELVSLVSGSYVEPLTYAWYFSTDSKEPDADTATAALDRPGTYVNPRVVVSDAKGQRLEKTIEGTFSVFPEGKVSFFVDAELGNDAASGTEETPWKTLMHALAAESGVQDGDEIVLSKGVHLLTDNLTVDRAVTIRGAGENWETTLDADHKQYSVFLTVDGARIESLTFYRLGGGNYHADYVKVTADAVVSNVVFTSCGWETGSSSSLLTLTAGLATCCYLTNNTCARNAGMTLGGTAVVENCVIVGNTSLSENGGGVLKLDSNSAIVRSCTVANNKLWKQSAVTAGAYVSSGYITGQIYNTIIWNNNDMSTGVPVLKNWYSRGGNMLNYRNNCTTPLKIDNATMRTDEGNIDGSPDLKQNGIGLGAQSSCIGAGEASTATTVDIMGISRGEPPCIGACEYVASEEMELNLASSENSRVRLPETVQLFCSVSGAVSEPLTFAWSFNGDSETVDSTDQNPFIAVPGTYRNPKVTVRDGAGQVQVKSLDGVFVVHAEGKLVRYVDYATGDNANDGTAAHPWKTLSTAVDNAELFDGDEIILAKGDHVATAQARITKALYVHGAGTREETRLVPNGASGRVDGLITISANGATVSDFTISGFKQAYQTAVISLGGYSTVSNIVVANCGNEGTQNDTTIVASKGLVTGCIITNNIARGICGMLSTGPTVVENCLFANNRSLTTNMEYNPSVVRVYWAEGGDGTIRNCTIVDNTMTTNGAAAVKCDWALTFVNNIVRGNTDTKSGDAIDWRISGGKSSANWKNNCLPNPEKLTGTGNFDADPLFRNATAGDYRLHASSRCRNAGNNALGAQASVDVYGNKRRVGRNIDVGCAECIPGFSIIAR